jgi:hypothetical protein
MSAPPTAELVPYSHDSLLELLPMWREKLRARRGHRRPHPLAEQQAYFVAEVLPKHDVRLALRVMV